MSFFVYFDNDTRDILSITNEKIESKHSYVQKQKDDVEDFIQGKKNLIDYKFDKEFNFVVKNQQTKDVVSNSFVEIKQHSNAVLNVCYDKKWIFSLTNQNQNINGDLFFAVTEKNNPNKLIRTIFFDSQHAYHGYDVDFKYKTEEDIENVSIWAINPPYKTANLEIK